jgi:hypothetical protein
MKASLFFKTKVLGNRSALFGLLGQKKNESTLIEIPPLLEMPVHNSSQIDKCQRSSQFCMFRLVPRAVINQPKRPVPKPPFL